MTDDLKSYINQALMLVGKSNVSISNILPSDWCEMHRLMTSDLTAVKGKFKYYNSPYSREIVDTLHPSSPVKICAVMKAAQIGFALDIDTLIPTPYGWSKMKDLKVGDRVFDELGNICNVTKATDIMHGHKCYKVCFSDGSNIDCDAEHLWTVTDEKNHRYKKDITINTEEISKTFKFRGDRNRYAINNAKPLILDDKNLIINPYVLGLWLGDGHKDSNRITGEIVDLKEIEVFIKDAGENCFITPLKSNPHIGYLNLRKPKDECCRGHRYTGKLIAGKNVCRKCQRQNYNGNLDPIIYQRIGEKFKKLNLYGNKHIPNSYLRGSFGQRLELLQGLIDSDGHITKNSQCEFYNTDKNLIKQVYELVASLGLKPKLSKRNNSGKMTNITPGKTYPMKDIYIINFKGYSEIPVSKLSRKLNRLKPLSELRHSEITRRRIVDVIEIESRPVKCISVDSKSHLYLAGENMIPTHNSTGVIEAGIAWIIANAPGNILFLVGHSDLVKDSGKKLDTLIDNTGIRHLIRSTSKKARNTKTGDTDTMKEYSGGYLKLGITNHKMLRNISMQYGFIDDFDGMKSDTESDGATTAMIEQRFAAFENKKKIYYISTPTVKDHSNIEKEYLKGDQRKYHIPCPCCDTPIVWEWEGITWKLDDELDLIEDSVGYTCQECGGFFDDRNKMKMINQGVWIPTAKPSSPDRRSYHLSALIAPIFMTGWEGYIRQYLEANPVGGTRDEKLHQTFCNLVLGVTYEQEIKNVKADQLQNNIRPYEVGVIPESLSEKDGNGRIVLITCGSDLNGKLDDARLDYEIVAHSESGATYSITHGSIGSFIPKDANPEMRLDKKTYKHGEPNSVWPIFEKIIQEIYYRDSDGEGMRIFKTGVDVGYMTEYAYQFLNTMPSNVIGLKGDGKVHYGFKKGDDIKPYRKSSVPGRIYNVESNLNKDNLHKKINLQWTEGADVQPYGFMNFPAPINGKYLFSNYFSHFEAETKTYDKKTKRYVWKKGDGKQNHLFDCRIYSEVCKYIYLDAYFKENKINNGTWADYVESISKKRR